MPNKLPQVSYDRFADVLYITISHVPAVSREEDAPGVFWRYDLQDKRTLVGVTILDFESYWSEHKERLIAELANRLNLTSAKAARVLEAA